jgi:hypothetical protein
MRVRRVAAELAHQEVAVAIRALGRAQERERSLTELYETSTGTAGDASPNGSDSAAGFIASHERGARLSEMLADAAASISTLTQELVRARHKAASAQQQVAVLERLRNRHQHAWRQALEHQDAVELDDFTTIRAATRSMEANRVG